MQPRLQKTALKVMICIILAMLLHAPCARGDMLLFATSEDCETAVIAAEKLDSPHAVVLQKAGAAKQKTASEALKKAGVSDVSFLDFPMVKANYRSAETLEKKWSTDSNTARVASLLRQWEDDCIVYFASGEEDRRFLSSFADKCAGSANDPACRKKKKQGDEYLHEVTRLIDGITWEEYAATPADTSWRTVWDDRAVFDLSGFPGTDDEGFLPEGEQEFVLEDAGQGLWAYFSQTLRIVISRHAAGKCAWFEADIRRRPEGETLHVVSSLNGLGNNPEKVAGENRLVLKKYI